jgi:hypothetical protein
MATNSVAISKDVEARGFSEGAGALIVLGRSLLALIFLFAAPNHFTKQNHRLCCCSRRASGLIAVPLSGVAAIVGGLTVFLAT